MKDIRDGLANIIPIWGFLVTLVGNLLLVRQIVLVLGIIYAFSSITALKASQVIPQELLNASSRFVEYLSLALLIWLIQESIGNQSVYKAKWFFLSSGDRTD